MTTIERFKKEARVLQDKKDVLFTDEIRATKTYKDMHVNKESLDEAQSTFLKIVEKFNDDCLGPIDERYVATEEALDNRLAELEEVLQVITDTIYTIKWEKYE